MTARANRPAERTATSTFDRVAADLAHQAFPEMASAMRERIPSILELWRGLSIHAMPHLDALTLEQFENAISTILAAAADACESADARQLRGVMERSSGHGIARFVQNHSLLDLFEEVRILRGVVIAALSEEMRRSLNSDEAATFHAVFDLIVQQGVMALVQKQEEKLQLHESTMCEVNERLLVASLRQHELSAKSEEARVALKRSESQLEEELLAAQTLQTLTNRMLEEGDAESLHESLVDAAMAIMHSDFASLHVIDTERGELHLLAHHGFTDEAAQAWEWIGVDHATVCGEAMRTGARSTVTDIDGSAWGEGSGSRSTYAQTGIRSVQATTCISRQDGRVTGVIATHWRRPLGPGQPAERALRAIDALARQAADLFDRREMQTALRVSEERYRALFHAMDEGYCIIDMIFDENQEAIDYRFLHVNRAFEGQSGLKDATSKRMLEFAPIIETHWLKNYGRVALTGEPVRFTNEYKALGRWFDVYAFRAEAWGKHAVAVLFTDVTVRIGMQRQIDEYVEALATESKHKDEFLAMLSHELRNPLAPISTAVQLMKGRGSAGADGLSGRANAHQDQALEVIERQVGNLSRLTGDLLEVSRAISGRVHLDRHIIDLNDVLSHAVETVAPHFDQHDQVCELVCCPMPVWCSADAVRLEEVFVNLLNNAAKFTPDGGRIEVWCEHSHDDDFAVVHVRDNGVGIDKEVMPRIFGLFMQADRSLARSRGGLGVGLALAKRILELHGGAIEVHSPPQSDPDGKGSEFIVRLAVAPAPASVMDDKRPRATASPGRIRRVLVVDDNVDLVTVLAASLRQRGYAVESAHTGPDGLEVARQWRPDVVLLDIGLPGLDGYEVARSLKAERFRGRLIAMTGYGRDTDVAAATSAGFAAHVVKPFALDELEKAMEAPAGDAKSRSVRAPEAVPPRGLR